MLHCLYGDFYKVEVLRLYFLESVPPSEIADRLGLPKEWVVGYLRRMKASHGPKLLAAAVRRCYRELMGLETIVVKTGDGVWYCLLCGRPVGRCGPHSHIRLKHRSLLEELVSTILGRTAGGR